MNMKELLEWVADNRHNGNLNDLLSCEALSKLNTERQSTDVSKTLWMDVVSSIQSLRNHRQLNDFQQTVLFLAILFRYHGQFLIADDKKDDWERKGASWIRQELHTSGASFELRETVSNLIQYQNAPFHWKSNSGKTVCRLSYKLDMQLFSTFFYIINELNASLKVKNTKQRMQKLIEELPKFNDDEERYRFFNKKAPKVFKSRFIMMMGLQGSGKDWYVRQNLSEFPMISLDNIRQEINLVNPTKEENVKVADIAEQRIRDVLKDGGTIVYNATNTNAWLRKKWLEIAKEYDARTEIIYIHAPFEQQMKQNVLSETRNHTVPEKEILRYLKGLSMPEIDEAVSLTICDNTR